jgi:hypothetical protein
MKKFNLISKLIILFFSANVYSQSNNNLESIYVEKYYQANAADVTAAGGASSGLTTNHIVYRVYAKCAPGYKVIGVFGEVGHPLKFTTSTSFFNASSNVAINNVSWIDSYLAMGTIPGTTYIGLPKNEDVTGSVLTATTALQNNPGTCMNGLIATTNGKDGVGASLNPSQVALSQVGFDLSQSLLDQYALLTNINVDNAAYANSAVGAPSADPTGQNRILIGQFTTDGLFSCDLNIQIKDFTNNVNYKYVYASPNAGQIQKTFLSVAANTAPTVSMTASPSTSGIITGTTMTFTATAADVNGGTVSGVEFFDNGVSIGAGSLATGTSTNGTYTKSYTASANGAHAITAKATDNDCASTTSSATNFTVASNGAPVVSSVTATTNNSAPFYAGQVVNLSCNAIDNDATSGNGIASVTFSVAGGSAITGTQVGTTNVYTATYTILSNANPGTLTVVATATESYSAALTGTNNTSFTVVANTPPAVSVTSPTNGASLLAVGNPATLSMTLTATATDANGIGSVVFYDNGTLLTSGQASSNGSTYTYVYTASPGTHTYYAKATDNYSAITNSATVAVEIADPNALSYKIKNVTQNCDAVSYCMPVSVASTYTVANVIGYDISLSYDATKVTPTGNITLSSTANGLINPNFVDVSVSIGSGSSAGTMQVVLSLNGAATSSTYFAGTNKDIFCIEFLKTAGFTATDNAVFSNLAVQESYITGVAPKPGSDGSAISVKNTTYISNLEFWSDNQAIKYDVANPSSYLKTEVKGSVSTTATATSASTSMTVTSATGVATGMIVVANGVPVGTTVSNVNGTTVTLSAATTAALSSTANPPSAVTFVNPATPVTPNTSGVFTHSLLNGQDLRIERDIAASTQVQLLVNAADAVLAKTLVLNGNFTPSVFQIMALDVNLDGVVSAGDISQIKQRATLYIDEYRQAWNYTTAGVSNGQPSKDWIFVDQSRLSNAAYQISATFPANDNAGYSKSKVPAAPFNLPAKVTNYATCPIVEVETYKGIMLGDVNASYAAFTANGLLKSENGAVVLDLASAVKEGNTFRIPVSFESTESANALDFAVRFNENNVSFSELNNVAVGMEASSFMNQADRTFRFTGFDVANFTVGATVAELVLQSNNETISEKDIISDLALINGKPVDVKFEKSSEAIQSVFNVSIYPNPSNGAFSVQATENAIVDVYDMNGKQIAASQVISSNGKVNIDLNNVEAGVYLVRVQNETFSTTKRIVIEK